MVANARAWFTATTELLNLSRNDEKNASVCSRIMFKIDVSPELMRYIYRCCHFLFNLGDIDNITVQPS